ncbi:DUF2867 domain-containing protein [Umezawaea sp.]|uniref:DUF2867 domain-containing protein n=1 Tax=Umezawaea sp. TaxID=1955258 RepID=UPI002ED54A5B
MPTPASSALPRVDYADAHSADLPEGSSADPRAWVDRLFAAPPPAFRLLVGALGFGERGVPFPELARTDTEVVLGVDGLHLDFRVGVHVSPDGRRLTVGTAVGFHNPFGRLFFLPVRLVHGAAVRSLLRGATGHRPENG